MSDWEILIIHEGVALESCGSSVQQPSCFFPGLGMLALSVRVSAQLSSDEDIRLFAI